jgi:thiosulfate reductase cytochrome b subunit
MSYERVKLYPLYERVWHWIQAAVVLVLLITGLEIRDHIRVFGFEASIRLHNFLGFFLLFNAFLGLFYYLTSGAIQQYVAEPRDFATLAVRQVTYYLRGIFKGDPHPVERTARARLNPMQKATYIMILNVLLPWQILTGFAIWGLSRWPHLEDMFGGLVVLLPLHALGAWLFAAFVIAHVYLTTTSGRHPLSGIEAMITGYEEMEVEPKDEKEDSEAQAPARADEEGSHGSA